MSEFWVSHKKYFCKYCNIYIADDKPSRTQHETGLRHKGNVERFVRNLYKTGEKRKADLEEEKREMVRIQRAADAAYAQDVSSGLVKPGSSSSVVAKPKEVASSKPARSSNPYADYSTAESLGITDPDEERRKMEAERRSKEGVVGDWEFVATVEPGVDEAKPAKATQAPEPAAGPISVEGSTRKREAEAPLAEEDIREFKLKRKKLDVGLGELYDPGVIPIRLKAKKEEPAEQPLASTSTTLTPASTSTTTASSATPLPKWTAKGWKRPGESTESQPPDSQEKSTGASAAEPVPKTESSGDLLPMPKPAKEEPAEAKAEEGAAVKQEAAEASPAPSGGSMFRKRKAPPATVASRGRRM